MKVLLLEDVDNLGYAGEVKDVANGFGRNYLLPREMAVLATPGALKQAETIRKVAEKKRAQQLKDARAIANQLGGVELLFERRAGETGKLYGSVTSTDIADSIEEQTGIAIDKRKVALPEPIRDLGEQNVSIKLMIDMSTSVTVHVLPLGGILERERLTEAEAAEAKAEQAETAEAPERQTMTPEEADIEISAELPETEAPAAEVVEETEAPAAELVEETEAPAEAVEETETPAAELVEETEAPTAAVEETEAPTAAVEETEAPTAAVEETEAPTAAVEETEAPTAEVEESEEEVKE